MEKILIVNTGGTFNKKYNALTGNLDVGQTDKSLQDIFTKWLCNAEVINVVGKDSLDITQQDRDEILEVLKSHSHTKIIIIHGTDTMDLTAQFLYDNITNKTIVLTGAMVPHSIDSTEAVANLASSIGFIQGCNNYGVYISMNGVIDIYTKVKKDKKLGKFIYDYQP